MTKAFKQPHIHGSGCLQVDFGVCGQHCLWKSNTHISTPALRLWKCFRMHTLHQIHCPCPCPCRCHAEAGTAGTDFMGPHWTWLFSHGTLEGLISTRQHVLKLEENKGELALTSRSEGIRQPTDYQRADSCRSSVVA